MGYFTAEHWTPVALPKVFAFFSDPNNLPRLMPPELRARVILIDLVEPLAEHPAGLAAGYGSTITFSFRPIPFLPVRQKWVAQITNYDFHPDHASFSDRQLKGPFKSWIHDHRFESETRDGKAGTLITDRVEFEVGYGAFGRVFEKSFLSKRMREIFVHRQATLEQTLR
jgi:ligand-binding SRPBCC domain-containing protein